MTNCTVQAVASHHNAAVQAMTELAGLTTSKPTHTSLPVRFAIAN